MKAVRYHEDGAPSVLRYEDVERRRPEAGQLVLRVAAVAFNPSDAAMRAGYLQKDSLIRLVHAPEYDVAGTVVELGNGVTGRAIGDAMIAFLPLTYDGAAAEFVLVPAGEVTTAPAIAS